MPTTPRPSKTVTSCPRTVAARSLGCPNKAESSVVCLNVCPPRGFPSPVTSQAALERATRLKSSLPLNARKLRRSTCDPGARCLLPHQVCSGPGVHQGRLPRGQGQSDPSRPLMYHLGPSPFPRDDICYVHFRGSGNTQFPMGCSRGPGGVQ